MVRDKRLGETARRAVTCALTVTLSVSGTPSALAEAIAETEQTATEAADKTEAAPTAVQGAPSVAEEAKADANKQPAETAPSDKPAEGETAPATDKVTEAEAAPATDVAKVGDQTPEKATDPTPHIDREVPFAASAAMASKSLRLRFYDGMPSVPYVGVSSFLEALWGKDSFTVVRDASTCTIKPAAEGSPSVTIDLVAATIASELWGTEVVAEAPAESTEGAETPAENAESATEGASANKTVPRTIRLSDLGIAPTADEADVWLPLATLSDLFDSDAHGVIGLAGDELVSNASFNETGNKNGLARLMSQETRPSDLSIFTVDELSLMLETCLAPTSASAFSRDVIEHGLVETLTKDEDPFGCAIFVALNSQKVSEYLMGLKALEVLSEEDLTFDLGGDTELDKSLRDEATKLAKDAPESPLAQAYLKGASTSEATAAAVRAARDKAFADAGTYHEAGSVALITLDAFDNGEGQVNPALTEGLEKARKNPDVAYVVVDLTTNTSSSASLFDCLDAMSAAAEAGRTVEAPAAEPTTDPKPDQAEPEGEKREESAPEATDAKDAAAADAAGKPAGDGKADAAAPAPNAATTQDTTKEGTDTTTSVKAASEKDDIAIVAASEDTPFTKDPAGAVPRLDTDVTYRPNPTERDATPDERKRGSVYDDIYWLERDEIDQRKRGDVYDEWVRDHRPDVEDEVWWTLHRHGVIDDWPTWRRRPYLDGYSSSSSSDSTVEVKTESKPEKAPDTTEPKPTETPTTPVPVETPTQAPALRIAVLTSAASSADANRLAELAHEKGMAVIGEPSAAVRRIMLPHLTADGLAVMVTTETIDAGVAVDANLVTRSDAGSDYAGLFDLKNLEATLEGIHFETPAKTDETPAVEDTKPEEQTPATPVPDTPAPVDQNTTATPETATLTDAPKPALTRIDTQAATCTAAGHVTYWTDANGTIFKDEAGALPGTNEDVAIDPIGHMWSEGQITQEPTETGDGVITYTCSICQETRTETIPATGKLSYYLKNGANPTWTKGALMPISFTLAANQQGADPSSHIKGVTVDGIALSEADFTHVEGMPAVSLTATYLETLAKGTHTVQVTFDDVDAAQTQLTIRSQAQEPIVTSAPVGISDYANTATTNPFSTFDTTSTYDATAATAPAPVFTTYDSTSFATTAPTSTFGEFSNPYASVEPTAATGDASHTFQVVSSVITVVGAVLLAISNRLKKIGDAER